MAQSAMSNEDMDQVLNQAEIDYEKAQEELYRPSTDVVAFSACLFSRRALHHYLYYFYKKYGAKDADKPASELTIEQMAGYCSQYNDRIARIDFENMHCRDEDVTDEENLFFCNDVEKLNSCKSLAGQLREIVMSSES